MILAVEGQGVQHRRRSAAGQRVGYGVAHALLGHLGDQGVGGEKLGQIRVFKSEIGAVGCDGGGGGVQVEGLGEGGGAEKELPLVRVLPAQQNLVPLAGTQQHPAGGAVQPRRPRPLKPMLQGGQGHVSGKVEIDPCPGEILPPLRLSHGAGLSGGGQRVPQQGAQGREELLKLCFVVLHATAPPLCGDNQPGGEHGAPLGGGEGAGGGALLWGDQLQYAAVLQQGGHGQKIDGGQGQRDDERVLSPLKEAAVIPHDRPPLRAPVQAAPCGW